MAVTETLGTASELTAAGIAADNLVVALYFGLLFALARNLPAEAEGVEGAGEVGWWVCRAFGRVLVYMKLCHAQRNGGWVPDSPLKRTHSPHTP